MKNTVCKFGIVQMKLGEAACLLSLDRFRRPLYGGREGSVVREGGEKQLTITNKHHKRGTAIFIGRIAFRPYDLVAWNISRRGAKIVPHSCFGRPSNDH